jgi:hypothetical protein
MILPLSLMGQAPAAILHAQGGVWVNGYEAPDSSSVFTGDLLETKTGVTASLNLDGTTIQIQQESVAKLEQDLLALDHGTVSVGTNKGFKVRVNCIKVIPVLSDQWTQYDVTDVNGTVLVVAKKSDVRVEMESSRKSSKDQEASPEGSNHAVVHEGEQSRYQESEACGAPARTTGASSLNPKWIGAGAAGAGVLIWLLVHGGGGKTPLSVSEP